MAGGTDDEADAGLVESAERVVEIDGDAVGDAGCRWQYRVLPAAAWEKPGIAAADDDCQSMWASSVTPSVIEVTVLAKRVKSSRCSHPVLMTSSQAASRE
jgi:hypothetical protein